MKPIFTSRDMALIAFSHLMLCGFLCYLSYRRGMINGASIASEYGIKCINEIRDEYKKQMEELATSIHQIGEEVKK